MLLLLFPPSCFSIWTKIFESSEFHPQPECEYWVCPWPLPEDHLWRAVCGQEEIPPGPVHVASRNCQNSLSWKEYEFSGVFPATMPLEWLLDFPPGLPLFLGGKSFVELLAPPEGCDGEDLVSGVAAIRSALSRMEVDASREWVVRMNESTFASFVCARQDGGFRDPLLWLHVEEEEEEGGLPELPLDLGSGLIVSARGGAGIRARSVSAVRAARPVPMLACVGGAAFATCPVWLKPSLLWLRDVSGVSSHVLRGLTECAWSVDVAGLDLVVIDHVVLTLQGRCGEPPPGPHVLRVALEQGGERLQEIRLAGYEVDIAELSGVVGPVPRTKQRLLVADSVVTSLPIFPPVRDLVITRSDVRDCPGLIALLERLSRVELLVVRTECAGALDFEWLAARLPEAGGVVRLGGGLALTGRLVLPASVGSLEALVSESDTLSYVDSVGLANVFSFPRRCSAPRLALRGGVMAQIEIPDAWTNTSCVDLSGRTGVRCPAPENCELCEAWDFECTEYSATEAEPRAFVAGPSVWVGVRGADFPPRAVECIWRLPGVVMSREDWTPRLVEEPSLVPLLGVLVSSELVKCPLPHPTRLPRIPHMSVMNVSLSLSFHPFYLESRRFLLGLQSPCETCRECEPGRFRAESFFPTPDCSSCPAGTSSARGATFCEACPPGFANAAAGGVCEPCGSGEVGGGGGLPCAACPPGRVKQQNACRSCAPGRFEHNATCQPCHPGTYQSQAGASRCEVCSERFTTLEEGSSGPCVCESGFRNASGGCVPALPGEVCTAGGGCSVAAGYWGDGEYRCHPEEACALGGKCAPGYTGLGCGSCRLGTYFRINGVCRSCGVVTPLGRVGAAAVMLGLLASAVLYLLYMSAPLLLQVGAVFPLVTGLQNTALLLSLRVPWQSKSHERLALLTALNFNVDLLRPECALGVGYVGKWLLRAAIVPTTLALLWACYGLLKLFPRTRRYFDFVFKSRLGELDSYETWDIRVEDWNYAERRGDDEECECEPNGLRERHLRRARERMGGPARHQDPLAHARTMLDCSYMRKTRRRFVYASVALMITAHPFVSQLAAEPFICVSAKAGVSVVRDAPQLRCWSPTWALLATGGGLIGFMAWCVFPCLVAKVVCIGLSRHQDVEDLFLMDTKIFLEKFGSITTPYNSRCAWWTVWRLVFTGILTLSMATFADDPPRQVNMVFCVMMVHLFVTIAYEPYLDDITNYLAIATGMLSSLVTMWADVTLAGNEDTSLGRWVQVGLVVTSLLVALVCLAAMLGGRRRRRRILARCRQQGIDQYTYLQNMFRNLRQKFSPRDTQRVLSLLISLEDVRETQFTQIEQTLPYIQ